VVKETELACTLTCLPFEMPGSLSLMHDAIAAVNTAALREEIYYCGGKRKK